MGSEHLSHMFTIKDPTFKESSSSTKHEHEKGSSHNSMSHTSGTHPVAMSNGPKSSSSASLIKHNHKPNSKHRKLLKLHNEQLSHIETTLNAIESLSKPVDNNQNEILLSYRKRYDKLNQDIKNIRHDPSEQDHVHFDQLKNDIDQLIDDLKSYKMDDPHPTSINTIDHLLARPLDLSDSQNNKNDTLIYF